MLIIFCIFLFLTNSFLLQTLIYSAAFLNQKTKNYSVPIYAQFGARNHSKDTESLLWRKSFRLKEIVIQANTQKTSRTYIKENTVKSPLLLCLQYTLVSFPKNKKQRQPHKQTKTAVFMVLPSCFLKFRSICFLRFKLHCFLELWLRIPYPQFSP